MPRREYTDEERAAILANYRANGGNLKKTARESGVPVATLRHWTKDLEGLNPLPPRVETPKPVPVIERTAVLVGPAEDRLAMACDRIAERATGAVEAADLPVQTWQDAVRAMTVADIAIGKSRLLRDRATSITGTELTDEQRIERLREVALRVFARRIGAVAGESTADAVHDAGGPASGRQGGPASADLETPTGASDHGL